MLIKSPKQNFSEVVTDCIPHLLDDPLVPWTQNCRSAKPARKWKKIHISEKVFFHPEPESKIARAFRLAAGVAER